jgi:hypothetical protein
MSCTTPHAVGIPVQDYPGLRQGSPVPRTGHPVSRSANVIVTGVVARMHISSRVPRFFVTFYCKLTVDYY